MRPPSLRLQLFAGFAGLNGVIVVAFALFLYAHREADLWHALDTELLSRAEALAAICEWEHGHLQFDPAAADVNDVRQALLRNSAVATWPQRQAVAGDPALVAIAASVLPPDPLQCRLGTTLVNWRAGERAIVMLSHVPARPATPEEAAQPAFDVLIVAASNAAPIATELARLRTLLTGAVVAALAIATFLGLWFARRIVRPVADLAAAARATHAGSRRPMPQRGAGDELDALASALDAAFARLEDARERQTRFAADASHELRTPISIIQTTAEVALLADAKLEPLRAALSEIRSASERMGQVLEALLALARADQSVLAHALDECNLTTIVRSEVDKLRAEATARQLQIEITAPRQALLQGEECLLRVLVNNLLRNSITYSDGPGIIRIGIEVGAQGIDLIVADEGSGIPPEVQPRVFERFFRADASRNRSSGGAGLGLALVKSIAEVHGATCTVHSEPGTGTTMTIRFPNRAGLSQPLLPSLSR